MLNGKTKGVQYIIEKVFRGTGLVEGIDIHDCIEWVAECLELIGRKQSFTTKVECITIENGRGDLPCDIHLINQSRVQTSNGYAAMRAATDSFHMHCKGSPNMGATCSVNYSVSDNCIFPNFDTGVVEMSYEAIATDKNGWPVIPDDIKFVKAVEYYIREKVDYKLWRSDKISTQVYEKTVQEQVWYLGAAQTRGVIQGVDQLENIKNNWLRMIPKINQHEEFFATLGNPEQRINHSGKGVGSGGHSNTVDGDDYFDYLANKTI